jgi:hypothetical protein
MSGYHKEIQGYVKNITNKCLAVRDTGKTQGFKCKYEFHKVGIEQNGAYCNVPGLSRFHLFPYIFSRS